MYQKSCGKVEFGRAAMLDCVQSHPVIINSWSVLCASHLNVQREKISQGSFILIKVWGKKKNIHPQVCWHLFPNHPIPLWLTSHKNYWKMSAFRRNNPERRQIFWIMCMFIFLKHTNKVISFGNVPRGCVWYLWDQSADV